MTINKPSNERNMNTQQIAEKLNGSVYPFNLGEDLQTECKENGFVVVCGASDDIMEFYGAFRDELGAYEGATAHINSEGLIQNECGDYDCPHYRKIIKEAVTIDAIWTDNGSVPTWTYETKIPHETFLVLDDDNEYCRGIVFSLADVDKAKTL